MAFPSMGLDVGRGWDGLPDHARASVPLTAAVRSHGPLEVVEVASDADFMGLEEAWNQVARDALPRSIFLRHEWLAAAWAWRRLDSSLHTLVARRGTRLVGALPLICRSGASARVVEYELLTIPDTQLADMLCAPADAEEVAGAFASVLCEDKRWDKLRLDLLSPDGPCAKSLSQALRARGVEVVERDCGRNFCVSLSGTWDEYYCTRSRSLKKAMHLASNRLHNSGEVSIEWLRGETVDPAAWQDALEEVIAISAKSWKRATGNSLDQAGPQAFVRSLSHRAVERGWLAIWLLRVENKPLAMEYGLIYEGDVHALRSDFDAVCVRTSPGTHLFSHLLANLFGRGLARYYMGRGENPYKLRWTNEGDPLRRVFAYNRTPGGRFEYIREEYVKPALRRTRDALWHGGGST